MSDTTTSESRGTDGLVEDLLRKPRSSLRDELVRNALLNRYHDFKSSHAFPKMLLVDELTRFDFEDLARRARRGEYDDRQDAADHAELARMIAEDPDLAEAWDEMEKTQDPAVAVEIARRALGKKLARAVADPSQKT